MQRDNTMRWIDYDLARNRHDELLRASQQNRLATTLLRRRVAFYAPLLARTGQWLIAWGWRLRARYGEIELHTEVRRDWLR
jgi:hypothetical protein